MRIPVSPYHFHIQSIGNPQNPRILFLHGFMGSGEDWQDAIAQLSSSFHCLTLDLPGHGQTQTQQHPANYTLETISLGIISLLKKLQYSPCFLVGYSMGGRLALYLALHFPQCFPKVILESASPGLKTASQRQQRQQQDTQVASQLIQQDFAQFLQQWYQNPLFHTLVNHPQFPQMMQRRLHNNPHELAQSLLYMGTGVQPSLWESLTQHQDPLLLCVGEKDPKFLEINQEMAQLCPTAQLQVIPNCGHNIHLENVDLWVKSIRLFLGSP